MSQSYDLTISAIAISSSLSWSQKSLYTWECLFQSGPKKVFKWTLTYKRGSGIIALNRGDELGIMRFVGLNLACDTKLRNVARQIDNAVVTISEKLAKAEAEKTKLPAISIKDCNSAPKLITAAISALLQERIKTPVTFNPKAREGGKYGGWWGGSFKYNGHEFLIWVNDYSELVIQFSQNFGDEIPVYTAPAGKGLKVTCGDFEHMAEMVEISVKQWLVKQEAVLKACNVRKAAAEMNTILNKYNIKMDDVIKAYKNKEL